MLESAQAFSPGHITGFFRIWDGEFHAEKKGSTGAGFCLGKGVTTRVRVNSRRHDSVDISINGASTESAEVSHAVATAMLSRSQEKHGLEIAHRVELPIGAGFGTSGAGALSLALALNKALDLRLSLMEAAEVAHVAEIQCRTGLGTVVAAVRGGGEIRTRPGGPANGVVEPMPIGENQVAISLSFGPFETPRILSDPELRKRINLYGQDCLKEILTRRDSASFMMVSRSFTDKLGLCTKEMRETMVDLDKHGHVSAMAMLGQTIFTLTQREDTAEVLDILRHHSRPGSTLLNCSIDRTGVRLL